MGGGWKEAEIARVEEQERLSRCNYVETAALAILPGLLASGRFGNQSTVDEAFHIAELVVAESQRRRGV